MKGDFTRVSDQPYRRFTSVQRQQGRVDLDADWNEAQAISNRLRTSISSDTIGASGTSTHSDESGLVGGAFFISPVPDNVTDVFILDGRYYIDGVECSNLPEPRSWRRSGAGDTSIVLDTPMLDGWPIEVGQWLRVYTDDYQVEDSLFASVAGVSVTDGGATITLSDTVPLDVATSALRRVRRLPSLRYQLALPPSAEQLSPPAEARVDLIYLEAWERGVTDHEDPGLREVALGGPDTATRTQQLPQVRVLQNVDPQQVELPRPTLARLSTGVVEGTSSDDPCVVPPDGGYRGLENRLYRVRVFDGGQPFSLPRNGEDTFQISTVSGDSVTLGDPAVWLVGQVVELFSASDALGALARVIGVTDETTVVVEGIDADGNPSPIAPSDFTTVRRIATFVWSRDNGSVTFEVLAQSSGTLAADQVVIVANNLDPSIAAGQWLEIQSDNRELQQLPGILGQVVAPPDASGVVSLSVSVDAIAGEQRPRAVRWDGEVGRLPIVPGSPRELEDGVLATFAGRDFRAGDYWSFTARTITRSVEELEVAPPNAAMHRYAKLALVRWALDGNGNIGASFEDCRTVFDPLTLHVLRWLTPYIVADVESAPFFSIQEALDQIEEDEPSSALILVKDGFADPGFEWSPGAPRTVTIRSLADVARGAALSRTSVGPSSVVASSSGVGATLCLVSLEVGDGLSSLSVEEDNGNVIRSVIASDTTFAGTLLATGVEEELRFDDCSLTSGSGAALLATNSSVRLENSLVNGGTDVLPTIQTDSNLQIRNCDISNPVANGPALECTDQDQEITIVNSMLNGGDGTTANSNYTIVNSGLGAHILSTGALTSTVSGAAPIKFSMTEFIFQQLDAVPIGV